MSSLPDDINSDNPENAVTCKYYEELQNLKTTNKSKPLSLFHINVYSLSKNFNNLEHLLSWTNKMKLELQQMFMQQII